MGNFFNGSREDRDVEMRLMEIQRRFETSGLLIQGIEGMTEKRTSYYTMSFHVKDVWYCTVSLFFE